MNEESAPKGAPKAAGQADHPEGNPNTLARGINDWRVEREEQGFGPTVTDPTVLNAVAVILRAGTS